MAVQRRPSSPSSMHAMPGAAQHKDALQQGQPTLTLGLKAWTRSDRCRQCDQPGRHTAGGRRGQGQGPDATVRRQLLAAQAAQPPWLAGLGRDVQLHNLQS